MSRLSKTAPACIPDEHARRGRAALPTRATLEGAAQMLEAAGDAQRLRLLVLLCEGPMSVGELAAVAKRSPSLVSQQLAVLRSARLVRGDRRGRFIVYRLFDGHTQTFIESAIAHAKEA